MKNLTKTYQDKKVQIITNAHLTFEGKVAKQTDTHLVLDVVYGNKFGGNCKNLDIREASVRGIELEIESIEVVLELRES